MNKSAIITRAPSGGIYTLTMSDHPPFTPSEKSETSTCAAEEILEKTVDLETLHLDKPSPIAGDEEIPLAIDTLFLKAGAAHTSTGLLAGEYAAEHSPKLGADSSDPVASTDSRNCPPMIPAWKIATHLAVMKGSRIGRDMSVYALNARISVRHVMVVR